MRKRKYLILFFIIFGIFIFSFLTQREGQIDFPIFVDLGDTVEIEDNDVPLSSPKVTTKVSTKKNTRKVKLKSASKKTYSVVKKDSKTNNYNEDDSSIKKVIDTKIVKKFVKKSKIEKITTTVTTTTTTTIYPKEEAIVQKNIKTSYQTDIRKKAPLMNKNILNGFEDLGFSLVINPSVSYTGYFDAKSRLIELKTDDDEGVIYHELGHFIAWIAGNVDKTSDFQRIYNLEKDKLTKYNALYVNANASEYFAESVLTYYLDNNNMKQTRPETYRMIENAISVCTKDRFDRYKQICKSIWE
jgi:hypothetical protein